MSARGIRTPCLLLLSLLARPTLSAELDPVTGSLVPATPDAVMIGFEDPGQCQTLKVALTKRQGGGFWAGLAFLHEGGPAITEEELTAYQAAEPAVEGTRALAFGSGAAGEANGVLVPFDRVLPLLGGKRKVQITAWVRVDGASPVLTVAYGKGPLPLDGSFASVTAIRSGRETSDNWAELTTGPIDTEVWGSRWPRSP